MTADSCRQVVVRPQITCVQQSSTGAQKCEFTLSQVALPAASSARGSSRKSRRRFSRGGRAQGATRDARTATAFAVRKVPQARERDHGRRDRRVAQCSARCTRAGVRAWRRQRQRHRTDRAVLDPVVSPAWARLPRLQSRRKRSAIFEDITRRCKLPASICAVPTKGAR